MTNGPITALETLRQDATRNLTWVLRLYAPVILGAGLFTGHALLPALALWLCIVTIHTLTLASGNATAARCATATALCAMPALLVLEFEGHAWQADLHMVFFAMLATSAAMLDARAILAAASVVAVHHLVLNLILPEAVFPGSGDLVRVLLHAVVLAIETAALIRLAACASRALRDADAAGKEAARLASDRARTEADASETSARARRAATLTVANDLDAALGTAVMQLVESSQRLETTADVLTGFTSSTAHQAGISAENSQTARHGVRAAAAASDEMTNAIADMSARVAEAADAAHRAKEETRATEATVQELSEGAARIDSVVKLIGAIAAQTNLLALNATIEAARAGPHGTGFAVVASEVKLLANQTASATKDIGAQIARMQDITTRAVAAVGTIGRSVEHSSQCASAIAASIEQQTAATRDIAAAVLIASTGTQSASDAVALVSTSIAKTSLSVIDMRAATSNVADQGATLKARVSALSDRLRQEAAA